MADKQQLDLSMFGPVAKPATPDDLATVAANPSPIADLSEFGAPLRAGVNGLTSDTPMQESPVSIADRFKLSFGNQKGAVNYLKEKFQDAKVNGNGDLVVKQNGIWKAVDPDGWGTANTIAGKGEEFLKDFVDLSDDASSIIATGAGASVGGAPGAVLAGAGASYANSSLGRWLGTYDASDGEQIADAALDSLMVAGGYAILPAGKIAAKMASGSAKNLLKATGLQKVISNPTLDDMATGVLNGVKNTSKRASNAFLRAAASKPGATEVIIQSPDEILTNVRRASKLIKGGKGLDEVNRRFDLRALKHFRGAVQKGRDLAVKAIDKVDEDIVTPDFANVTINTKGFVPIISDTGEQLSAQTLTSGPLSSMFTRTKAGLVLRPKAKVAAEIGSDFSDFSGAYSAAQKLLPALRRIESGQVLKGKDAVKWLADTTRTFSDFLNSTQSQSLRGGIRNIEKLINDNVKAQVSSQSTTAWQQWTARENFRRNLFGSLNNINARLSGSSSTQASTINQSVGDIMNASGFGFDMAALKDAAGFHKAFGASNRDFFKPMFDEFHRGRIQAATKDFIGIMPRKISLQQGALTTGFFLSDIARGGPGVLSGLTSASLAAKSPRLQLQLSRMSNRFGSTSHPDPEIAAMTPQAKAGLAAYLQQVKSIAFATSGQPGVRGKVLDAAVEQLGITDDMLGGTK